MRFVFNIAVVRKCAKRDLDPKRPKRAQKVCLYAREGSRRLLGRHPDVASAARQVRAIRFRQSQAGKARKRGG